jgi:hypothetical protein
MDQQLYKYLVLCRSLTIPQLGSFVIKNEPAYIDNSTGLLHAPKPIIVFSDGLVPKSEKLFFDFLATELGVDEVTAIKQFHDHAYRLREELLENNTVELKGIGTLVKGEDHVVTFQASNDLAEWFPPLSLTSDQTPALHNDSYETIEEKGKYNWVAYALILFVLGLGALLYYYS